MNKKARCGYAFLGLILLVSMANAQEIILIVNGKIRPIVGKPIDNGCLLIENGKVAKIGTYIQAPPKATVIDAKGMFVFPGMIALMTEIGVTGYPGAGNDVDELGVTTPQADPYDAINPEDSTIEVTRLGGITTAMTISGTMNVVNGKSVVINLDGNLAEEMILKRDVAQVFNLDAKAKP